MKKYFSFIVIAVSVTAIITAGIWLGAFYINQPNYTTQLKSLFETKWAEYKAGKAGFDGELTMLITSPNGDYFVSTGLGNVTADTHFRAASTTKTFTAGAILLLQQEGKLQISDKITDNIPGTARLSKECLG